MTRPGAGPKAAIVVTGLPASGKTTLARAVARALGWPLLDKDDFLETLYETHAVQTLADRSRLSRQSDALFQSAAQEQSRVVLVSHWAAGPPSAGGTPTDWLDRAFDHLVEVYCSCPPDTATARFQARRRHSKHLDHLRLTADLQQQIQDRHDLLPLGLGPVVTVNTEGDVDLNAVLTSDHLNRVQS